MHSERDDPWCRVYGLSRGRSRTVSVRALKVGGVMLTDWGDCVSVFFVEFFYRAV